MFVYLKVLMYNVAKEKKMNDELIEEKLLEYEEAIEKALAHQINEYAMIKAGRANPHILDKITVDYYGAPTPIKQMANISVSEGRILNIAVWDVSQIRNVTKAILASDIGINPSDDGKVIRLVFPQLTEERRREIVKDIKKIAEDTKVPMRNARRDVLDFFKDEKKNGNISEDDLASYEKDVQKTLDDAVAKVDANFAVKEKEILEI